MGCAEGLRPSAGSLRVSLRYQFNTLLDAGRADGFWVLGDPFNRGSDLWVKARRRLGGAGIKSWHGATMLTAVAGVRS